MTNTKTTTNPTPTPNIENIHGYFRRGVAMDRPDYFAVVLNFINNDQEAQEHLGFNKYFCYSTFREAEAKLEGLAAVKSPKGYRLTDVNISWFWFPSKAKPQKHFQTQNLDKVAKARGLGYKVIMRDSNYYYTLGKPRNTTGKITKLK